MGICWGSGGFRNDEMVRPPNYRAAFPSFGPQNVKETRFLPEAEESWPEMVHMWTNRDKTQGSPANEDCEELDRLT